MHDSRDGSFYRMRTPQETKRVPAEMGPDSERVSPVDFSHQSLQQIAIVPAIAG
jgi:hypothetical protein